MQIQIRTEHVHAARRALEARAGRRVTAAEVHAEARRLARGGTSDAPDALLEAYRRLADARDSTKDDAERRRVQLAMTRLSSVVNHASVPVLDPLATPAASITRARALLDDVSHDARRRHAERDAAVSALEALEEPEVREDADDDEDDTAASAAHRKDRAMPTKKRSAIITEATATIAHRERALGRPMSASEAEAVVRSEIAAPGQARRDREALARTIASTLPSRAPAHVENVGTRQRFVAGPAVRR